MIWFTSDLHLFHNKEFIYSDRGYGNIDDHNAAVVANINSLVKPEDDLYILGDLFLNSTDDGINLLKKLNGIKHIILGNHDTDTKVTLLEHNRQECKIGELVFATRIKYKKYYFYLSHYPTITHDFDSTDILTKCVINLYGHTHQKEKFYNNNPCMYNVGLDAQEMYPVSIDKIIEDITEKAKEYIHD